MRHLRLAQQECWVRKTGLPFLDANRLFGVAYYFFGHATAQVRDRGGWWQLRGPRVQRTPAQIRWVGDRLKGRGYERIEPTTLKALEGLEDPAQRAEFEAYFATPDPQVKAPKASVGRYLEPGFLRGARGPDAFSYGALASEKGVSYSLPRPEVLAGTIGIAFAGTAWGGGDDRWLILPVLDAAGTTGQGGPPRMTLGPFYDFDHRFSHHAGGLVAAVGLALQIADQLGRRLPVADFAYAHYGARGFYESGTLGVGRLLRWDTGEADGLVASAARFFRSSGYQNAPRHLQDTARALAELIHQPTPSRLERLVRLKGRGMDQPEPTGSIMARLFYSEQSVKEVCQLANPGVEIPDFSELATQVAKALALQEKGWVGWFTRLEGAQKADQFALQVERLLARTAFRAERDRDTRESRSARQKLPVLKAQADWMKQEMARFKKTVWVMSPAQFRFFKSTFLAEVLPQVTYYRYRQSQEAESPQAAAAAETQKEGV